MTETTTTSRLGSRPSPSPERVPVTTTETVGESSRRIRRGAESGRRLSGLGLGLKTTPSPTNDSSVVHTRPVGRPLLLYNLFPLRGNFTAPITHFFFHPPKTRSHKRPLKGEGDPYPSRDRPKLLILVYKGRKEKLQEDLPGLDPLTPEGVELPLYTLTWTLLITSRSQTSLSHHLL